jgi:hypothetical protein
MSIFEITVSLLLGALCVIGIRMMVTLEDISNRQLHDMAGDLNTIKIIQEQAYKQSRPEAYPGEA